MIHTADLQLGAIQWCLPAKEFDIIPLAARIGYKAISMDMGYEPQGWNLRSLEVLRRLKEQADTEGITICTLSTNGIFYNGRTPADELNRVMEESLHAARILGARTFQICSMSEGSVTTAEEKAAFTANVRRFCDLTSADQLTIGCENDWDADLNLSMLREIDRKNYKIYMDVGNPYIFSHRDGLTLLKELYQQICEVHVKDADLSSPLPFPPKETLLGSGSCHIAEALQFLKDKGFSGWVINENPTSGDNVQKDYEWLAEHA